MTWGKGRRLTEIDQFVDDEIDLPLGVGDLGWGVAHVPV